MSMFTDEQALAIFNTTYDKENGYSAQQIFDQVWEAPYSWFRLTSKSTTLPAYVGEVDDYKNILLSHDAVTEDQIKIAAIRNYFENWSKYVDSKWNRTLQSYLCDLDANDVDCILQLAMFEEIRYS